MPGTMMPKEDAQAALAAAISRGRPSPDLWDIWLWSGANINTPCPDSGKTALMTAAEHGHIEDINYLLSRSAQVDVQNPLNGKTALMYAAMRQDNDAVIDRLLAAGACTRLRDQFKWVAADHAQTGSDAQQRLSPFIDAAARDQALANCAYGQHRARAAKFKIGR